MERYEYRILQADITDLGKKELEDRLNGLGSEGWNLVSTLSHERHGFSREIHMILSRRRAE